MSGNIIEIRDGVARQPQYLLPSPVDLAIGVGEQVALVGANGSSKSIVVGMITGAIPLKGLGIRYDFGGESPWSSSRNIKYLAFRDSYGAADQDYYHQRRWNSCDRDDQPLVRDVLPQGGDLELRALLFDLFEIDSMLDKEVILLSSGELRKFQLTKALLGAPRVLILENPFIGLDATTRDLLHRLLASMVERLSLQIILVLSKSDDIPRFITHIIPVEGGVCLSKVQRCDFDAPSILQSVLPSHIKESILALPTTQYKGENDCLVDFQNVTISYGKHTILKEITWSMKRGEQWALSGDNGSGKSTFLSLICADNPQSYGRNISLFGKKLGVGVSIWEIKKHIGYVSPEMHRSYMVSAPALEIVASGLHDTVGLYIKMKPEDREVCEYWMNVFGILDLAQRDFMTISSGEQRLVLLARAFVKDPELLILDEPLHGLDLRNRRLALDVIETFCSRPNRSLIYVTHYRSELPCTITHSLHLTAPRKQPL